MNQIRGVKMPWTISKTFTFEAAHQVPHYDGKCQIKMSCATNNNRASAVSISDMELVF